MALVFNSWWLDLIFYVACFSTFVYGYFCSIYTYWKKKGIPDVAPTIPFGNLGDVMFLKEQIGDKFKNFYSQFKGHKFFGVYQIHRPTLVIRDTDLIKAVLVKSFGQFQNRGIYFDEENDPINAHLFLLTGKKWRNLRAKLSPTFTSGKMKMMFRTVAECGEELKECVDKEAQEGEAVEIKDLIARYSCDVIASCAFGIQGNCLKNPNAEFLERGKEFVSADLITVIGFFLNVMAPSVAAIVKLGRIPRSCSNFFRNVVKEIIEFREQNDVTRNDFMQLMIQLKNKGYLEEDGNRDVTTGDEGN